MKSDVALSNKKIELIQWLSTIEDISVLNKIMELRKKESKDWWNSISENEKKSIEAGLNDAENGKLNDENFMKNGFRIRWTDNALKELEETFTFLETNWTEKELRKLSNTLDKTLNLISQNPYIFQSSDFKKDIKRAVILSLNSLYYRIKDQDVEILSFFSNRQKPTKRKLK
jgi:plasmid stabilization system protein ParE